MIDVPRKPSRSGASAREIVCFLHEETIGPFRKMQVRGLTAPMILVGGKKPRLLGMKPQVFALIRKTLYALLLCRLPLAP